MKSAAAAISQVAAISSMEGLCAWDSMLMLGFMNRGRDVEGRKGEKGKV